MAPSRTVTITASVERAIRRHGEETFPYECCGALIARTSSGDGVIVEAVVPLANTTEEGPRRRFLVRPSDYRDAERRALELGGELVGFYHSHPDHPARPSQYDLDHAWPTFAYIIVAVAEGKSEQMTVWYLLEDRSRFEEGSLNHGEDSHSDTAAAVHR